MFQDSLAEEVSLLLERVADDANSTWVPCSNATVTIEGCLQSVAGGRAAGAPGPCHSCAAQLALCLARLSVSCAFFLRPVPTQ
jgi:hypothetical protein